MTAELRLLDLAAHTREELPTPLTVEPLLTREFDRRSGRDTKAATCVPNACRQSFCDRLPYATSDSATSFQYRCLSMEFLRSHVATTLGRWGKIVAPVCSKTLTEKKLCHGPFVRTRYRPPRRIDNRFGAFWNTNRVGHHQL